MIHSVPLAAINGVSPYNPRAGDRSPDADIDALESSIAVMGLLQPLLVHRQDNGFAVLDGRRRFAALARIGADWKIPVEIIDGDEAALRAAALAANTIRLNLHPIAEFEAFAELAAAGHAVEAIAAAFGLKIRQVRERLALGRLAPDVRDAWRAGRLTRDQAEAFSVAEPAAQASKLDELVKQPAARIRAALLAASNAIRADESEALFVGEALYVFSGGRIAEDLFSLVPTWRDGALVKKLAEEKLAAEAQRILETEGWGFLVPGPHYYSHDSFDFEPDYLPGEQERIDEIGRADKTAANAPELWREADAIEARAIMRAIPAAKRKTLGVCIRIDFRGALDVSRALEPHAIVQPRTAPHDDGDDADDGPAPVDAYSFVLGKRVAAGKKAKAPKSAGKGADEEPADPPNATARAIIDTACNEAVRAIIAIRPDIALCMAVAALGCDDFGNPFGLEFQSRQQPHAELLRRIEGLDFAAAAALCAAAPLADVTAAFAELMAGAFDATCEESLDDVAPVAAAIMARGGALAAALVQNLDRGAYFAACAKAASIAAIEAMAGPAAAKDAKGLKREQAAERAAILAEDRRWLPEPLAGWAKLPAGPEADGPLTAATAAASGLVSEQELAGAMDAALTEDDDGVAAFLGRCRTGAGLKVKASELHAAYAAARAGQKTLALQTFCARVRATHSSRRLENGVHFEGIALAEHA